MVTSAPQSKAALAMRISSVAMITASNSFARTQRSHTCRRSGLFAMRCNGFPEKRVELQRAGMIPTALLIFRFENDFGRRRQILSHPFGATAISGFVEPGPDSNRADAGIVRAFSVDLLVADQKRAGKVDILLARRLEDHPRRGFSALRRLTRHVRTKIGRVDQTVSELAPDLRFHCAIILFSKESAAEAALVSDDNNFVAGVLEATQCGGGAIEYANLVGARTIIRIVHDRPIAIDKDRGRFRSSRSHLQNSKLTRRV